MKASEPLKTGFAVTEIDGQPFDLPVRLRFPNTSVSRSADGNMDVDFVGGSLPTTYLKLDGTNAPSANYSWTTNLLTTGTLTGQNLQAYHASSQPYMYAFPAGDVTKAFQIYHDGSYGYIQTIDSVGTGVDMYMRTSTGKDLLLVNRIKEEDVVDAGGTPMAQWIWQKATSGIGAGNFSMYQMDLDKDAAAWTGINGLFTDITGDYVLGAHANIASASNYGVGYLTGMHGTNGVGFLAIDDVASSTNTFLKFWTYGATQTNTFIELRGQENTAGADTGGWTGKFLDFYTATASKLYIDYTGLLSTAGDIYVNSDSGSLKLGASQDFALRFDGDDAYFDLASGSDYIWRINSIGEMQLSSTLLDIKSNNFYTSGKISVGEASPASPIHVSEDNTGTSSSNGITIEQNGTGDALLHWVLPGLKRYTMGIDNSEYDVLTIVEGGNVAWALRELGSTNTYEMGIGGIPSSALDVTGVGSGRPRVRITATDMASNPGFDIRHNSSNNTRVLFRSDPVGTYGANITLWTSPDDNTGPAERSVLDEDGNWLLSKDNKKVYLGTGKASDSYLEWDESKLNIYTSSNITLGDGGTTNYAQIATDGEITLVGTARAWKSQDLKPANLTRPQSNPPGDTYYQEVKFDAYNDTQEEQLFYIWHVPNDYATGTASVRGHFGGMVSNEAGDEYVAVGYEYWKFSPDDTFDISGAADGGGAVNITIVNGEGNYVWHESATGTVDTTGWTNGDTIVFRFFRDVDDVYTGGNPPYADNYTGDVLIGVYHLEYLIDKLGEAS